MTIRTAAARAVLQATLAAGLVCAAAFVSATGAEDVAVLRGTVQASGAPAADAEVAAGILGWAPAAGDRVVASKSGADGAFELKNPPLGPIDVWVRAKGGKWKFVIRMWSPGVNDLAVDATPRADMSGFGVGTEGAATVTGVVLDGQGKALAGAMVGLRGDDAAWTRTDDKGQFTLEKAADGDGIVVRADGFRDQTSKVKLGKKQTAVKMSFKLAAAKPTVVHVVDPDGKPLPGAWVVLGDPDRVLGTTGFTSLFPPRERLVGGWTDANGDAKVARGDADDKTVATAYAARFAPASKAVVAGGAVVNLQLAPMRPAVATVTQKADGAPIAGVYVGLPHAGDGGAESISALAPDAERGPIVVGRTDENGRCVIAHLAADVDSLRVVGEMKLRAKVKIERSDGK